MSVLLGGEESEITFIDHPFIEMTVSSCKVPWVSESLSFNFPQPENCLSSYDPHGFLVIYSSSDRSSFSVAERVLQALWTSENIAQKAVILVGNKSDLARSRSVSTEGSYTLNIKLFS